MVVDYQNYLIVKRYLWDVKKFLGILVKIAEDFKGKRSHFLGRDSLSMLFGMIWLHLTFPNNPLFCL